MSQASQVFGNRGRGARATADVSPAATQVAPSMARNALIVGAAFVLSRVLGLAREAILANAFGTGPEMNAYVSSFRIPDLLFLVVIAGSFGAAFIPVFGEYLAKGDQARAWRLASAVLTWAGISVFVLSLICLVLARPLMQLVAPGFDRETEDLAVNLMRILLLSPIFLGLGIASKGILEAHHQFTLPALAPLIYNLAIIVGALFFVDEYGIYAVGWAVIVGALGHFLIQTPGLIRAGMRFRPTISRQVDGLTQVVRLLGPRIVGLAAFQVNFIVINAFASTSDDEHVSAINYAWQLLMLPHGVLALSISTVVFPTLAALYSRGERDQFRATLERTLRPLLFLSFPAAAGLFLLREPIVQVILESGDFDASSTELVIAPLAWFAPGLVGYALVEIITRVFYAARDTRTPVMTGVLTMVINIVLCALFLESLSHAGLALALSATTGAEAIILLLFLRHRTGHVVTRDFWPWLGRVIAATAGMSAVIVATVGLLEYVLDREGISRVWAYALFVYAMGMYVVAFVAFAYIFRIRELQMMVGKVANRLPGSLRRAVKRLG